jgi:hypothetical protein
MFSKKRKSTQRKSTKRKSTDGGNGRKKTRHGAADTSATSFVENFAHTHQGVCRDCLAPLLDLLSAVHLFGKVCTSLRKLHAVMMPHVVPLTLQHSDDPLRLQALLKYGNQWYGQRFQYLSCLPTSFQTFGENLEVLVVRKCVVSTSCVEDMLRNCPKLRELVVCESTALTRDIFNLVAAHGKALQLLELKGNPNISGWHFVLPEGTPVLESLLTFKMNQHSVSADVVPRMAKTFPNANIDLRKRFVIESLRPRGDGTVHKVVLPSVEDVPTK